MENIKILNILLEDIGLGRNNSYYRINTGFNNMVFSINEEYIVKICHNQDRETNFINEINFYNENNYDFIPEIITYDLTKNKVPFYYIIQKKIQGSNLYTLWSSLTNEERQRVLNDLLNFMKIIHSKKVEQIDYKNKIVGDYLNYLSLIENGAVLSKDKIAYLYKLKESITKIYHPYKICLIHGDLQFNNIILIPDGNIKIIDFEDYEVAPIEKEFDSLFRMSQYPHTFLQRDNNNQIDRKKFLEVKDFFEKNYDEVCKHENFANNILTFEILNSIRWIYKYPDYERYNQILFKKSKKLIL